MDASYQELITNVLLTVGALLFVTLMLFILSQWGRLKTLIDQKKTEAEASGAESFQNTLWSIAQEAYVYAEKKGGELVGDKALIAYDYAAKKLTSMGFVVTSEEIKAKVEEAWLKLDQKPKQASVKQQVEDTIHEVLKK